MLKVGDILWVFDKESYGVYEISELNYYNIDNIQFYFITADIIIGSFGTDSFLIPALVDYDNLVKIRHNQVTRYYTISEKEAVKFIREHYNN